MRRYALTLLIAAGLLLGLFAGFNLAVDPYAVTGWRGIEGISARKSRLHEDGGRVTVSHRLLRGGLSSIVVGSSRVVDGFPAYDADWPGGLLNAGMRGAGAFEIARAMALAGRDPALRCVAVGLDLETFAVGEKAKASYWITALPDANRPLALARMALSPHTFLRAVQTVGDNLSGHDEPPPFKSLYRPGEQRKRFIDGARSAYGIARDYRLDRERVDYLMDVADALAERGVQVIGFLYPAQAWRQEAFERGGMADDERALRRLLAQRFAALAARTPAHPCTAGGAGVLYDFGDFQPPSTAPLPAPDAVRPHPFYYEAAHFRPEVGDAMAKEMLGRQSPLAEGVRLTPASLAKDEAADEARRRAWAATPDGREAGKLLDAVALNPPPPEATAAQYLTRDDWRRLKTDLARVRRAGAH